MEPMLFNRVVEALTTAGATRSRKIKVRALADCLRVAEPAEVAVVADYLAGRLPQRRTGVGWASVATMPPPAVFASLTIAGTDAAIAGLSALQGPGSASSRARQLQALLAQATYAEQALLRGLLLGDVRSGALEATMIEAVAQCYELPLDVVRRAVMLSGSAATVASWAATGADLTELSLQPGRAAHPMLAAAAPDLAEAIEQVGLPCFVDAKLDGIRVQVHRRGGEISVWSRTLDDLTGRHPRIDQVVAGLPGGDLVLDGEALLVDDQGRARPFQETTSKGGRLQPFFFDLLHADGEDLIDLPLRERVTRLADLVPAEWLAERAEVQSLGEAESVWEQTLAHGHEGVVVKDPHSAWSAGRRGAGWIKVKPRHTFDLVVLAVEWGSGRRQGWLSNIHLGARNGDEFVMVGKTFKGMTDQMLRWQTERFLALETHREGPVVHVRPEQVVEIAIDGVQRSRRYPGGVALRFARVLGYRDDKSADTADSLESIRALLVTTA